MSMKILLFDMDGVLLQPRGYHKALQETVRLISLSLGFEEFHLPNSAIAQFEALGISNEFHSSAICMAMMVIELEKRKHPFQPSTQLQSKSDTPLPLEIDLARIFDAIAAQPLELPAVERCIAALKIYAEHIGVDLTPIVNIIQECEAVESSLAFNVFQELVLGSETFANTYGKKAQLAQDSYLSRFDRSCIAADLQDSLKIWWQLPQQSAAIMTNRPSNSLLGLPGTPEAELGAELVGLDFLPIIGFGEMTWLANQMGEQVSKLQKPAGQHALAAILAAAGMPTGEALLEAQKIALGKSELDLGFLDGSEIWVFEDTPAGIVAVERVRQKLLEISVSVQIWKIGIAQDAVKAKALTKLDAQIYDSVRPALINLL